MKRLKILRRWFTRKFGFARLVCLALLIVFAGLRVWDPPPVQELRLRTFDLKDGRLTGDRCYQTIRVRFVSDTSHGLAVTYPPASVRC